MCRQKGHNVKEWDPTFLPQSDGFWDETVDFVFMRHYLQHSPYPIFTLVEFNRLLKLNGKMYIEVPAPDCERKHEYNQNHYSILGYTQLDALLKRTGFTIDTFNEIEFDVNAQIGEESKSVKERYYSFVVTKSAPLDIK